MAFDTVLRFFHILAAAVWVGGMITVGALVPALRSAGVERRQLQAMARRFGVVSWTAMLGAIATGITQLIGLDLDLSTALAIKITLVGVAVGLAVVHQQMARHVGPAIRGAMEAASLLVAVGVLAAAVAV